MKLFKSTCRFWLIPVFGIFLFYNTALSQWYYSLSVDHEYNSNPFRLPENDGSYDQISELAFGIQKEWSEAALQYYGTYGRFNLNSPRNFYWHQLHLGGGDSTAWYLSVDNRINRTEYNIYDYVTGSGGIQRVSSAGGFLLHWGGRLSVNAFQHLSELNNVLVNGTLSANRSFQTRTSLIGALAVNYKRYLNQDATLQATEESTAASLASLKILQGFGPGNGQGSGPSQRYSAAATDVPAVAQIMLSFRVAQSLMNSTGLALQYSQRISLNSSDRSVAGLLPGSTEESQIFDDPLGYQGPTFGVELTQLLPASMKIKAAAYLQRKNYISQGVYLNSEEYDQATLRNDDHRTAWLTLEKVWDSDFLGGSGLTWALNYQWTDNTSNSYWYQYRNHYISTGIRLDF